MWTSFWMEGRTRLDVHAPGLTQVSSRPTKTKTKREGGTRRKGSLFLLFSHWCLSPLFFCYKWNSSYRWVDFEQNQFFVWTFFPITLMRVSGYLSPLEVQYFVSFLVFFSVQLCDMWPHEGAGRLHERAEWLVPVNGDPVLQLWGLPEGTLYGLRHLQREMSSNR